MKRLFVILILLLMYGGLSYAQIDPLNSSYLPSINTTCTAGAYAANIWLTDWNAKLRQDSGTAPTCTNGMTGNGAKWLTIHATQNEFADFQAHLHDTGLGTANLAITTSDFVKSTGPGGNFTISAATGVGEKIIVYREAYMLVSKVTATSAAYYNATGTYPDILIPPVDPYWGQTTNAWPFTVAAGKNQSAWVDILVPSSAPSGYYLGSVTVKSGATTLATMPVILAVWQWPASQGGSMPSTPTLRTDMEEFQDNALCYAAYLGPPTGSPPPYQAACGAYQDAGGNYGNAQNLTDVDASIMFKDHRWDAGGRHKSYPGSGPYTTFNSTVGVLMTGGCSHGGAYCPLLVGSKNTSIQMAILGPGTTQQQFTGWAGNFNANGWAPYPPSGVQSSTNPVTTLQDKLADEPGASCGAWTAIISNGNTRHAYSSPAPMKEMVTALWTYANACGALQAVDILVANLKLTQSPLNPTIEPQQPYFDWIAGTPANPAGQHREYWSYQACDQTGTCSNSTTGNSTWTMPNVNIDGVPTANRTEEWMSFRLKETGELYFDPAYCLEPTQLVGCGLPQSNDPWLNNLAFGGSGEGSLMQVGQGINSGATNYMGAGVANAKPIFIPTIRLKHWRDGVQDYEYLNALTVAGQGTFVNTQVSNWITNTYTFDLTGNGLNTARTNVGNAIHALTFGNGPWAGIIDPARATDWSQAGIPGGLPDAAWTLCNTLTPGFSGPASTLNAIYTACPNQSYIDVPAGTYTITSGALSINKSQVVYRGHGASQSHFVFTGSSVFSGCSGFNDFIQIFGADCNNQYSGSGWPNSTTWTAGYTQGSNQVTVGSTAGINLVGVTNPTLLFLTQVETGYTGFPPTPGPTQDNIDNGNYFDSAETYADQYNPATTYYPSSYANLSGTIYKMTGASPITGNSPPSANWTVQAGSYTTTGARGSSPGPVGTPKGNWILRWQYEVNVASSLATGASCPGGVGPCINLLYPLREPNWNTSQTPMIARINAITQAGIENLSIDTTAAPEGYNTIEIQDCYQCIVSGISVNHDSNRIISEQWSANALIQNNYFCCQGTANPDPYGIRFVTTGNNLVQNNIFQKIRTSIVFDGTDTGTVIFANYSVNQKSNSAGNMWGAFWQHSRNNDFQLWEQNIADGFVLDNVHGSHFNTASFRNLLTGWESCAALATNCNGSVKTAQTFPMTIDSINRYQNVIGNVLGTPGKTVGYQTNTQFSGSNVYAIGGGNFNYTQPYDPIVATTLLRWANWDTFNRTNQFNTGEVPSGISPYPNPVPTAYTGSGGTLPASFFISVKPSWWQVTGQPTIPWPGIGPDITGGNIVECSTSTTTGAGFDIAGQFNGLPTPNLTQCTGSTSWAGAWAGRANANPAMLAYLTLGGNLDGTSAPIPFDASIYSGLATPAITVTPSPIAFGNQTVGTTSAPMFATVTNTGTASLVVSNVVVTANFANSGTGTCIGTSFTLAASASCTIGVTFSPVSAIAYTGTLTVTSNAPTSPTVVNLSGTGQAVVTPSATLTPPTLAFGGQNINTTSGTLFATYTNNGSVPVVTSNIVVTGNFSRSGGTCVGTSFTLAVSSSCTVGVTFSPTATIAYNSTLTITDNSGTSPHVTNLTGTGTQATITWISPQGGSTYNYGNVFLGSSLNSGNLTLQNSGTGPLTVALSVTGTNSPQFVIFSNTCPNPLIAGASCNVVVTFTPAAATSYTAFLTETDTNASNSPQNLTLNGSGVIPVPNLVAPWPPIILGGN